MSKKTVQIDITGMSCGHCIKTVREALEKIRGVEISEVAIGRALVEIDEAQTTTDELAAAIDETGYLVRSIG